MDPRRLATLLTLAAVLAARGAPAAAGEQPTTAVTERGRGLDRILDLVLLPESPALADDRAVLLLLDPTPSLASADLPSRLGRALLRNRAALGSTRLAVAALGATARLDWRSLDQAGTPERLAASAARALEGARDDVRNVYAAVREAAGVLRRQGARRDLVLVTLENGDGEDDVEATVTAARKAGVRVSVVAREAFLADTYWLTHSPTAGGKDLDLTGGDAAFVDLPWGWLFQQAVANEHVPSGHAMYGLTRLAAASGGKVYLYYPPSAAGHACSPYGTCPLCRGDHLPRGEGYQPHRLRASAPSSAGRREVLQEAAHDPLLRALLSAWEEASRAGLVRSRPSVRTGGGGLVVQRPTPGRLAPLGATLALAGEAARAERLVGQLDLLRADLEAALEKVVGAQAAERWRATAETTAILLRITRFNLRQFGAFCREVAPRWIEGEKDLAPPEIAQYEDGTAFVGIGFTNISLCHAVRVLAELELPGDEALASEREDLADRVDAFLARWAHTPYAAVVRRSGLARFHLTVRGRWIPPPKRTIPGHGADETTTPPERPARGGTPAGDGGSPTSGGD